MLVESGCSPLSDLVHDRGMIDSQTVAAGAPETQRWLSLDALRGFDMIWIVGGAHFVHALEPYLDRPQVAAVSAQLHHLPWEGLRAYDVIFPLFVFVAGAAAALATQAREGRSVASVHWRLVRRLFILFALGVFYNGGFRVPVEDMRWMGVLQRIAITSFAVGLAHVHVTARWRVAVFGALVLGYGLALRYVPMAGEVGSFEEGRNLADLFDARFLPGRAHKGLPWDPEGILSTIPAIATGLLGGLTAEFLLLKESRGLTRTVGVLLVAAILVYGGLCAADICPIIKKIWTPSFVLVTGGLCMALLAVFHLIIDRLRLTFWIHPFLWIGANPLLAYLSRPLLDIDGITARLAGGDIAEALGRLAPTVHALLPLVLLMLALRFLYHRHVYVRV